MSVLYIQATSGGVVKQWVLDATTSVNQSYRSSSTEFKIESGANVSDNLVNKNGVFNIAGVLTSVNSNISSENRVNAASNPNKVKDYIASLKKLRTDKRLFSVRMGNEILTNCVFSSLDIELVSYYNSAVQSYKITASVKQLRFGSRAKKVKVTDVIITNITSEKQNAPAGKEQPRATKQGIVLGKGLMQFSGANTPAGG